MQIKTTMRYHFTPVRKAMINKSTTSADEVWRRGNPSTLLVGMQTGAATVETVWNFLKKLKMELPFYLAIPLLGIYAKNPKTPIEKNLCAHMFIALFTTAKI